MGKMRKDEKKEEKEKMNIVSGKQVKKERN